MSDTSPQDTRKLVSMGWLPDDAGQWTLNGGAAYPAATALGIAEALERQPKPVLPAPTIMTWLNHLSGTLAGTAGTGILTGIAAAILSNPPPEVGLSPTALTWMKWGLAVVGAVLVGGQIPKSMNAVKDKEKQ